MYRHPHGDLDKFMNYSNTTLDKIGHSNKLCTVMGDFNLDLLQVESYNETDNFLNTLGSSFFYPLILQRTRRLQTTQQHSLIMYFLIL